VADVLVGALLELGVEEEGVNHNSLIKQARAGSRPGL
jgi:hypothetical protein